MSEMKNTPCPICGKQPHIDEDKNMYGQTFIRAACTGRSTLGDHRVGTAFVIKRDHNTSENEAFANWNRYINEITQQTVLLEAAEEMVAYAERGTEQSYAQNRKLYHMHIQNLKAAVERAKGGGV